MKYILDPILMTLTQILLVLGPALGLGLVMHFLSDRIRVQSAVLIGQKKYIYITALGTVVHEASHAFFCLVFAHKITKISFFKPEADGTLGYVNHSYNKRNLYHRAGNFFIGSAPVWGGCAVLALCGWLLLPPAMMAPAGELLAFSNDTSATDGAGALGSLLATLSAIGQLCIQTIGALFSSGALLGIGFYIFAYICFCIGGHMTLSPPDIEGTLEGGIIIVILMLVFNFVMQLFPGVIAITEWMMSTVAIIVCSVMMLSLALNLMGYALLVVAGRLLRRVPA
jgi:hypothetical protein